MEDSDYRVDAPNADEYFANNSNLIDEYNIEQSITIQSSKEAIDTYKERGFDTSSVTADYSLSGEMLKDKYISNGTEEKYPMYQTIYVTESGDIWVIYNVNGCIMANPVSYNMQSGLDVQVLISESEVIMSYDSTTNKFYETIPNPSELIVKVIDKIDTDAIDSLTFEVIESL